MWPSMVNRLRVAAPATQLTEHKPAQQQANGNHNTDQTKKNPLSSQIYPPHFVGDVPSTMKKPNNSWMKQRALAITPPSAHICWMSRRIAVKL
mmetsp:Transcript_67623/g.117662  ORF Transcript_67623/g.117662 Transcript_67623/m.117662 type:complete len:93 (-) Transcript_67623:680-958(-)